MNIYYVLPPLAVIVFGMMFALSQLHEDLKKSLLSFDTDGWQPLAMGVFLSIMGLVAPDYSAARLMLGLGILFLVFGALISVNDRVTSMLLNPSLGVIYLPIAVFAFSVGMFSTGSAGYSLHALITLVIPVVLAAMAASLAALSLTSDAFKSRLGKHVAGGVLVILGPFAIAISPFAALNPALIIATAGLGSLLFTLGVLIVSDDGLTKVLLTRKLFILYAILLAAGIIAARLAF